GIPSAVDGTRIGDREAPEVDGAAGQEPGVEAVDNLNRLREARDSLAPYAEEVRQVDWASSGIHGKVGEHRQRRKEKLGERLQRSGDQLHVREGGAEQITNERAQMKRDVIEANARRIAEHARPRGVGVG